MRVIPNLKVIAVIALLLAAIPLVAPLLELDYLVTTFSRVMIFALAAVSLDLVLGYAGLVSFGHAAFLGVGAYAVGILAHHAQNSDPLWGGIASNELLISLPAAMLASGLVALVIGLLSLRTQGIFFIMITLAFSQMLYFIFVALEPYGGDDGLLLWARNDLAGFSLANDQLFYYVCLVALIAALCCFRMLLQAPFGLMIRAGKSNPRRLEALGAPLLRYQLALFVVSGAFTGLAGGLLANQTEFVSPDLLRWSTSGDLMVMVILGGIATLAGPLLGAMSFLLLEEWFVALTEHWKLLLGPVLILVVIFARAGLWPAAIQLATRLCLWKRQRETNQAGGKHDAV